jgi:tetratricopeptide (TPR) repeat protein
MPLFHLFKSLFDIAKDPQYKMIKYFDSEKDAQTFFDEIRHMLCQQMAAPNSPQWFNTGLYYAYGINGPAQGHHYVDPKTGEVINIETTARGVNLPSETYLGVETRKLQQRTIREVVGMAFMNRAAVSWHRGESAATVKLYERAAQFLSKDDYLLNMFLGFNYLFAGRVKEGKALLRKVCGVVPDYAITSDTVSEDFLNGKTNAEGIQAIFQEVDETRSSILKKQKRIEGVLKKYPKFRQGILHLAITYLQLGREKEALPHLQRYSEIDPKDPTAQYYLAAIQMQRFNFNEAWKHLRKAEEILSEFDHHPRALKDLRKNLQRSCPEPK